MAKENQTSKIKLLGNSMQIKSSIKLETIAKLQKYQPNSLCLCEEKNDELEEVFRIGVGAGSINKFGITFNGHDKDGYATATILLPEYVTDRKEYIKDNYAGAIFMLNELEVAIEADAAALDANFEKLAELIEEMD